MTRGEYRMTRGEYRVGIDFNPSGDDVVGKIKRAAADLIDMVQAIRAKVPEAEIPDMDLWELENEVERLKHLAMTDIETAAMHAVKAATKRAPGA